MPWAKASAPGMTRLEKTERRMTEIRADIHPIYERSLRCPVLRVKWNSGGSFRLSKA